MRFLRLLADELKAKHKKAVFFVAPLNRQLIEELNLASELQILAFHEQRKQTAVRP